VRVEYVGRCSGCGRMLTQTMVARGECPGCRRPLAGPLAPRAKVHNKTREETRRRVQADCGMLPKVK